MSNVINKVKDFFGLDDEYDEEYDNEVEENDEEPLEVEPTVTGRKQSKVVNINSGNIKNNHTQILIIKPTNFEEVASICDALKEKKIVVVNTNSLDSKVAQRLLDFMGGSCYALNGELQEADAGVYVLSPVNIDVTNEFKNELSSKGLFNWK